MIDQISTTRNLFLSLFDFYGNDKPGPVRRRIRCPPPAPPGPGFDLVFYLNWMKAVDAAAAAAAPVTVDMSRSKSLLIIGT